MSRLDSMIRRLTAQRDAIGWAAAAAPPGDVLEIGLGNGRTFDHLREVLPGRSIHVIERRVAAHPSCIPPADRLLEMEAEAALRALSARAQRFALVHYDLGIGDAERDAAEAAALAPLISAVLAPGALVIASQALPGLKTLEGPGGVAGRRLWFYRG